MQKSEKKKISEFVIKLKNPRYRTVERQKNESSSTNCKKMQNFFEKVDFLKKMLYICICEFERTTKERTLTYWILDTYRRKKTKKIPNIKP